MLFFFGEINPVDLDYCQCSNELFVEVLFDDLDEQDKNTFKKYITTENTIKVRKECTKQDGASYHGYCQIPSDDWLKEDKIDEFKDRSTAAGLPLKDYLPDRGVISKAAFKTAQEKYIENNKDTLDFNYALETNSFMGQKNIAKGIFGEVFFIPSVKRAQDELGCGGKAIFGQLYSRVINKITESNDKIIEAKEKIGSVTDTLNKTKSDGSENTERPSALISFEETLKEELSNWDTAIEIEIEPPNIDKIFDFGAKVWIDDGFKSDIERKGQGLQRAIIFALIKSLSNALNSEIGESDGIESTQITPRQASKSAYFIFEEPELYLHPQAQRELFDSLVQLSESNNQVILCTHSSAFINLDYHKSICIIRKTTIDEGTKAFQYLEELFTNLDDKKKFNLSYWINPDRSELFFAKKVILVEGPSDKTVIPYIAKAIKVFRHDYTFIECGGKGTIPQYILLLNKFRIPYVVVYDKDHQVYKGQDAKTCADSASSNINSLVDKSFGSSVVLENDIEEEIGLLNEDDKNKPFKALMHVQVEPFVLTDSLKQKIESIYS